MINRKIAPYIKKDALSYPLIGITGPRQSGKTTLSRMLFPEKKYANLEDPAQLDFALSDPEAFLSQSAVGMVIDEIQRAPLLFSYLQVQADKIKKYGYHILTGSQNFLLLEKISQSLAGRISLFALLPFGFSEIERELEGLSAEIIMQRGFFPALYDREMDTNRYYSNYIQTYVERDVRNLKNVQNLNDFRRFMRMAAARCGQLLNYASLADDLGLSHNTIKAWISILETSYIVRLLEPYHKNFGKRLVKMPKLYFTDSGLLCSLLGIESPQMLDTHPLRGAVFENFIIAEVLKRSLHSGREPRLSFWRDSHGHEIDLLMENGSKLTPIEIKSGRTISSDYFKGLRYFLAAADVEMHRPTVVYGGEESQERAAAAVLDWRSFFRGLMSDE